MAFDMMGNYVGGYMLTPQETEEQRLRRLAMENMGTKPTPVKETITTDPVTGERKIKIEGLERDLSAANGRTPTVSGPISPDMAAIRSVESGNRDFDAQGRPITSPRGAMYSSQVMPATASNPGFGVRPAQSQTAEEYNRVGQDYYNAMLQRYGGDREKALAAYNAGPGRVDRNMATNQGQLNLGQMPAETQGYIPRVMNRIAGAIMPSAQAAPAPQGAMTAAPVSPAANMRTPAQEAADDEAIFRATGVRPQAAPGAPTAVTPTQIPATQPSASAMGSGLQISPQQREQFMPGEVAGMPSMAVPAVDQQYDTLMQGAMVNPKVRNRLITDPNTPADVRRAAIVLERRALEQERETGAAQKEIQQAVETGNFNALAKKIKQETEGGSILKALFYKSIGMTNLALKEEKKLGAGRKWQTAIDPDTNQRAFIEYDADGLPISGYDNTGKELSTERLAAFGGGGTAGNLDIVGGSYVNDTTKEVGRMVTDKRTGRSFIQTDKGLRPMEGFRPQGQGGTLDMQRENQIMRANVALAQDWAELQNKVRAAGPESANRFLGEFNAKHPQHARRLQDLSGSAPQIDPITGRDTGAMAGPAPQVGAAGRPAEGPASLSASSPSFNVGGQPTAPSQAGPVQPGPAPVSVPAPAPVGGAGMSPADVESAQAAKQAGMIEGEKAAAEDVAKAKINNGKIIEQANTVQALTNQLIEHPGFSVSVGASAQPGFQFIPGTDKASFNAFFQQAKGQAFLSAIEAMRGLGALSNQEGTAATAAVTAMNLDMNERDFRKATHQLNVIMKRAADRNAVKAGQPLPFNEPDLGTQAKQNREAQTWLKRARVNGKNADGTTITQEQIDGVRQRLYQRGEID